MTTNKFANAIVIVIVSFYILLFRSKSQQTRIVSSSFMYMYLFSVLFCSHLLRNNISTVTHLISLRHYCTLTTSM